MPEYQKMKNADLEALLKSRGLPTGGKKADMVERLAKDDEAKQTAEAPASTATAAIHPEDEIDWDDDVDEASAKPTSASTATPAASKAGNAGGEGAIDNPQAVPDQKSDIDPSKTDDLAVKPPVAEEETSEGVTESEKKEETPVDYTRGLAATNLDEEIEKRKARAKKFGLNIEDDEGLKKLERMKKFGETGPPKGLDEALPERSKKRGREGDDDGSRNKRRGGGGPRRGRGGDRRRDTRETQSESRPANGGGSWMSEADRKRAEARKNRFAA